MYNSSKANGYDRPAGPRPLLKWAGGKTQMLDDILPKIPDGYGQYIEPFFGGGAVFFALRPGRSIIADSNPELVNLYKQVAGNVEAVIGHLRAYKNTEKMFYEVRAQDWQELSAAEAAARTIFLNKTCFNGLYRVNKKGQFNVPFGRYKAPKICDVDSLYSASALLKTAGIICGDYLMVLKEYAGPGDLVFLDPPYLPISEYSDFKRYTKEQFYEEDHVELAGEVRRLHELGCHIILTNSHHPLVYDLYEGFSIDVIQTRRYISCDAGKRKGEDIIVSIPPEKQMAFSLTPPQLPPQVNCYPSTRYMGSKSKLLAQIWAVAGQFEFESAVDLFSGSGIVGYMFKAQGKAVICNDYMSMAATYAKAMIENNKVTLPPDEAEDLLLERHRPDNFVTETFKGLYYTDEENALIDILRANILALKNPYKRAVAMAALIRAAIKKRPRGIFTYTGARYDDGRRDLKKSLADQFLEAAAATSQAVFDNGYKNKARLGDAMSLKVNEDSLIYIDPPYYSPLSDNEYVRRYHFVEGLARNWEGVEIQAHTQTKKFKSYPTPFSTRQGAAEAFDKLFKKYAKNILIVSYSSNSQPTLDEMVALMSKYKSRVEVVPVDHRYSFGNQGHKVGDNKNKVQEYLFVGY
ncbi:DNA adenine methylase [Deltaproteobacteria bacterium Smac51]|nr:DNA adenine methylase [Deltaproteobacteria bacterium Smac51]